MADQALTSKIDYAAKFVDDGLARIDAALEPAVRHAEATGSGELKMLAGTVRSAMAEVLSHTAEWAAGYAAYVKSNATPGSAPEQPPLDEQSGAASSGTAASSPSGGGPETSSGEGAGQNGGGPFQSA